ncbi:MAG: hypothetical protein JJT78_03485 [Leptospira sp.]|nr:hypothetical protein [Leptospira sp.]
MSSLRMNLVPLTNDLVFKLVFTKEPKLDLWLYVFRNSAKLEEEEMSIIVDKEPDMANVFKILEYYSGDPEKLLG